MLNTRTEHVEPTGAEQGKLSHSALLTLWHLTDSALPTGGFAHSAGMEEWINRGVIDNAATFRAWLKAYLWQTSYNEALALRTAMELSSAEEPNHQLEHLDHLCYASQAPSQIRSSTSAMGKRMARIGTIIAPDDPLVAWYDSSVKSKALHGNPGIAAGLVLRSREIPTDVGVQAFLFQLAASMTQNAVRAIPLGQDTGQRVLVESYPLIDEAAEATLHHSPRDLGVTVPNLEISQMEHEYLHTRMFIS